MILLNTLEGEVIFTRKIILSGSVVPKNKLKIMGDVDIQYIVKGGSYPTYEGEYVVIPKVYSQLLETNAKAMADDVTVREIPKSEVPNAFNGLTVTIG